MAFDNVRLPEQIERGATGGPRFQTSILALGTGAEQRNSDWSMQRCSYDISYGMQYKNEDEAHEGFAEIVRFFYARRGRARSFRFKDWVDYEAKEQVIGEGDGTETSFQLVKHYGDFVRKITKPVEDTVSIFVDGVEEDNVSINLLTGEIIFVEAPEADAVITATFEFDVPVRFDSDELNLNINTWNTAAIEAIRITEVNE